LSYLLREVGYISVPPCSTPKRRVGLLIIIPAMSGFLISIPCPSREREVRGRWEQPVYLLPIWWAGVVQSLSARQRGGWAHLDQTPAILVGNPAFPVRPGEAKWEGRFCSLLPKGRVFPFVFPARPQKDGGKPSLNPVLHGWDCATLDLPRHSERSGGFILDAPYDEWVEIVVVPCLTPKRRWVLFTSFPCLTVGVHLHLHPAHLGKDDGLRF